MREVPSPLVDGCAISGRLRNRLRDRCPQTRVVACVAQLRGVYRPTCVRAHARTSAIHKPCATRASHATTRVCGQFMRNGSRNLRNLPTRKKEVGLGPSGVPAVRVSMKPAVRLFRNSHKGVV